MASSTKVPGRGKWVVALDDPRKNRAIPVHRFQDREQAREYRALMNAQMPPRDLGSRVYPVYIVLDDSTSVPECLDAGPPSKRSIPAVYRTVRRNGRVVVVSMGRA